MPSSLRRLAVVGLCAAVAAAHGATGIGGVRAESITSQVLVNPLTASLSLSATEVEVGIGFEAFGLTGNEGTGSLLDLGLALRGDAPLAIDDHVRSLSELAGGSVHGETWSVCGQQPGSYVLLLSAEAMTASGQPFTVDSPAVLIDILPAARICGAFPFDGFYSPVENPPIVNLATAGSAIPVKFSLGGDRGLEIFSPYYPASLQVTCDSAAPLDAVEETAAAGSSGLSYDSSTGVYTYVWKTKKAWAGTCRRLSIGLTDGSIYTATFKFRK